MKIVYINVYRGLYNQYFHLQELLASEKDVIILCVAEPKIKNYEHIPEFQGFDTFVIDPAKLVLFIKKSTGFTVLPIWEGAPAAMVKGRQFSGLFMYSEYTKQTMQGSKGLGPRARLEYIKNTVRAYEKRQFKKSFICADFNFCALSTDEPLVRELINFMEIRGFTNLVKRYTRMKVRNVNDRNAALDHFWCRDLPGHLKIEPFAKSDHHMLKYVLPSNKQIRSKRVKVQFYRPTVESEQFMTDCPLDGQSTYFEKQEKSLQRNYDDFINWCQDYRELMKKEVYRSELDVPWWNPVLTNLKNIMKKAIDSENLEYHKRKYDYYFNFYRRQWVTKNYKKKGHPFMKDRTPPCTELIEEGVSITNGNEICESIMGMFIGKIEKNKAESRPNWGPVLEAVQNWIRTSDECKIPKDGDGNILKWDIWVPNREEVRQMLRQIAAKKSSSTTNISLQLLKTAEGAVLDTLTVIIQKSIASGKFADGWHDIVGVPILKAGKPETDVKSYRVICLEQEVLKLISFWVAKIMQKRAEQFGFFDRSTHGFLRNRSVDSFTQECIAEIHDAKMRNEVCTLLATDLASAYDITSIFYYLDLLELLGAGPLLLSWLRTLYTQKNMVIRNADSMSAVKNYAFNLLQGNAISCVSFNICVFPIRLMVNTNIKKFADDLLLCVRSSSAEQQLRIIREEYALFESFVSSIGMKSARNKLMVSSWARKLPEELKSFELAGEILKDQDEIRILGIYLQKDLSFSNFIQKIIAKVKQKAGLIRLKGRHLPTKAKVSLYEGWIMGRLNFGIETYGPHLNCTQLSELQTACNYGLRASLGLFRKSSDCITEYRSKYKKPSFLQVCRDRVERAAFRNIEKFREKDAGIRCVTRAAAAGEVKKYNNLHKNSLERFQRRLINELELYKIKSVDELQFLQNLRKKEEFESKNHLKPAGDGFARLDLNRTECHVNKKSKIIETTKTNTEIGSRCNLPPKATVKKTIEKAKRLKDFFTDFRYKKFVSTREQKKNMGKKHNES